MCTPALCYGSVTLLTRHSFSLHSYTTNNKQNINGRVRVFQEFLANKGTKEKIKGNKGM